MFTSLPEDAPPGAVEKARQELDEIDQLIVEKKYEFVTTFEGASGEEQYAYRFTLADGKKIGMNFSIPLEDVASWDDYIQQKREQALQKIREQEDAPPGAVEKGRQELDEIDQLIAQKKYEFITTYEGVSGEEQYVYRFTLADGRKVGMNFSIPLEDVASWDDYIQQKRELEEQRQE
ncbi:MAG: hypothetical protein ACYTG0_11720 [Planctomycetota bacterium]